MPQLVQSFRFPASQFKPKVIPTKEELKRFFEAIDDDIGKALFLFFATTGLRKNEVLSLAHDDIDPSIRLVTPKSHSGTTKHCYLSFYNRETERFLKNIHSDSEKLFDLSDRKYKEIWKTAKAISGIGITPQKLRQWFCSEMALNGVSDSYINAFCGRTPKSVLARHYLDYSQSKMKQIYEKADLKVVD
jgi:integrase